MHVGVQIDRGAARDLNRLMQGNRVPIGDCDLVASGSHPHASEQWGLTLGLAVDSDRHAGPLLRQLQSTQDGRQAVQLTASLLAEVLRNIR